MAGCCFWYFMYSVCSATITPIELENVQLCHENPKHHYNICPVQWPTGHRTQHQSLTVVLLFCLKFSLFFLLFFYLLLRKLLVFKRLLSHTSFLFLLSARLPAGVLWLGRVHGQRGRRWDAATPGRHQDLRPDQHRQVLPGLHQRAVRQSPGDPSDGGHALLPPLALR